MHYGWRSLTQWMLSTTITARADFSYTSTRKTIKTSQKTISVKNFSDIGAAAKQNGMTVKIDVKRPGRRKRPPGTTPVN
jgi:hypothetical protein